MNRILAATDFSPRADLALDRAALLARLNQVPLDLVHVVDPDRPAPLVEAETMLGQGLLEQQAERLASDYGIAVGRQVYQNEAFLGICDAVEQLQPDLLVIGAYRRRLLQDIFIGTTAERSIRRSRKPVLIVNQPAGNDYAHALAALDLSDNSVAVLRMIRSLQLNRAAMISVVHLFEAPAIGSLALSSANEQEIDHYLAGEQAAATEELDDLLHSAEAGRVQRIVRPIERSIERELEKVADELGADLVVIGGGASSGGTRLLLGSTTLEILRTSRRDILVVPNQGKEPSDRRPG